MATLADSPKKLTFTDLSVGPPATLDADVSVDALQWRPGHNEIWVAEQSPDFNEIISIAAPGTHPVEISGQLWDPNRDGTNFTPDGAYWFGAKNPNDAKVVVQVSSADNPLAPRFDLNPTGTTLLRYWALADGRILAPVYSTMLREMTSM